MRRIALLVVTALLSGTTMFVTAAPAQAYCKKIPGVEDLGCVPPCPPGRICPS